MNHVKPMSLADMFKLKPEDMVNTDADIYYQFLAECKPLEDMIDYIDKNYKGRARDLAFYRLGMLVGYIYMIQDSSSIIERVATFKILGSLGGKKLLKDYLTKLLEADEKAIKEKLEAEEESNKPYV